MELPVIDLAELRGEALPAAVVDSVARAAADLGFFQVVNHEIAPEMIDSVWESTRRFFAQNRADKLQLLRTKENTRGYYDRELTKNARDLKEVLDLAHVPFPLMAENDPRNHHAIDGQNQWPELAGFREVMLGYLAACEALSLRLLRAFCAGLDEEPGSLHQHFGPDHTSFVRLNYYPLHDPLTDEEAHAVAELGDMALHHHSDAGALTLLLQDDVGGLQVAHQGVWLDVEPVPGALVVNTGDMMQVWSNDRYRAALHRVVPRTNQARYSLPYFFNPSYATDYAPLPGAIRPGETAHYTSINWGDFRQARADGDFADYGAEVQISDFTVSSS